MVVVVAEAVVALMVVVEAVVAMIPVVEVVVEVEVGVALGLMQS